MNNIDEDVIKYGEYYPPYTFGSHASKLIKMLRDGHEDVKLSQEEFVRLVTWVDSNAQFFGSYNGRQGIEEIDYPDLQEIAENAESVVKSYEYP